MARSTWSAPDSFDDTLSVYRGRGDGTFAERQVLATGTMPSSAVTADLNRDRAADLVSANLLSGDVSVVLNESPAKALCTGDCDGQGAVGINELVRSVSVALGRRRSTIASPPTATATA